MTYKLNFRSKARKEWNNLNATVRVQFSKKLDKVLENPRIPAAALQGMRDCYKIKLRDAGYRLVYQVEDEVVTVTVIAIGRRDGEVYENAAIRQ